MDFRYSGFVDGHCHPLFASREAEGPILDAAADVTAALEILTAFLETNPETQWLDAGSLDRNLPGMPVTAAQLDLVSVTIPVVVHASDHHAIWVNSAALRLAGFEQSAPQLANAHFEVDASGKPTGMVHEWDAMSLIYNHQPKSSIDADLAALDRAQTRLLGNGVVAVQEAWIDRGMPEVYLEAAARDLLRMFVNLAPRISPNNWREDLQFAKATRSAVRAAAHPLLSCNTIKIFVDGVLSSQTALLKQPYCGHQSNFKTGTVLWEQVALEELALAADSAGFQLHFHAIGDAAVSQALDAIQYIDDCNGPVDRRPVIAHAELIDHSDLERMRRLGVVVCQQPVWAEPGIEREALTEVLGEERTLAMYPIATLLEAGVVVSFGSDWPVSDPNPLHGLYQAITRQDAPEQALAVPEAIRCYSQNGALQIGLEAPLGIAGSTWVEWDVDLVNASPTELVNARVIRHSVNGVVTKP